uniref:Conjugal transfer pilus assembly protein TraA n=1 Tax=mine drainage metagenome TaxID=410659 RepID=E6QXE0_9ZZZZ
MKTQVLDFRILALLGAMLLPVCAVAGTTGQEFLALYTWVNGVATGYGGRVIAIAAVIIGALLSVGKGNPIPILIGIGFAIFLQYTPTIVNGILTATI